MVRVAEPPVAEHEIDVRAEEPAPPEAGFDWTWLPFVLITLLGLGLRLFDLGSRAMHHDESLHAVYSWYLYVGRGYVHDPLMHGPFLFHITALMYLLFGDSEVTARLPEALLGTATVALPYFLRRELGRAGALVASALLALGPAYVYFSRFAREDALVAFETLLLVVGLFGWLRARRAGWLYTAAAALALLFSNKEVSFIVGFTFVNFFLGAIVLEYTIAGAGQVRQAVGDIGWRRWGIAAGVFFGISGLLYTTFFTNWQGLCTALWSPPIGDCGGKLGALQYWLGQQDVARGGQPWYYYFLVISLYQPLALVLAIVSGFLVRPRTLLFWFCVWWAVLSILIYSWAGEKMPWLVLHPVLPLVLLAGFTGDRISRWLRRPWGLAPSQWRMAGLMALGLAAFAVWAAAAGSPDTALAAQTQALRWLAPGAVVLGIGALGLRAAVGLTGRQVVGAAAAVGVGLLAFYEVHSTWQLNYKNGDTPVEILVYVQSAPDVPFVVRQVAQLGQQLGLSKEAPILLDGGYTDTVAGQNVPHEAISWPFEWYLRDWKTKQYYSRDLPADFSSGRYVAVLAMAPNLDPIRDQFSGYTGHKFRLNWWYPEDYKQLTWGTTFEALLDPVGRQKLVRYILYRDLVNPPLGAREFYFYVRNDLVGPSTSLPETGPAAARPSPIALPVEQVAVSAVKTFGKPSGVPVLRDPKGIAVGPDGRLYVADGTSNTVTIFNPDGSVARTWGQKGSGDGEFNEPWGIAVAPDGSIFVADTWNHRIEKFDAQGRFLTKWGGFADSRGQVGNAPGSFYGPRSLAFNPAGELLVTDTGNKRIQVFDQDGHHLRTGGGEGAQAGRFREPVGLAVDALGRIYVADTWNQRIQVLSPSFEPIAQYPVPAWTSQSAVHKAYLAVTPDGEIYATVPEKQQIVHFKDGDGSSLSLTGGPPLSLPLGIVVDPSGRLRVADAGSGVVVEYELAPPEPADAPAA